MKTFGSSPIKSIQRGRSNASTITISPVNLNKSMVVMSYEGGGNSANQYQGGARLINSSTLQIYHSALNYGYGAGAANWEVVEYV